MIYKHKLLREAIEVEGATFIGNARGYDLFKLNTYAAAQQFVSIANGAACGHLYFDHEGNFNSNIANGNNDAYIFVQENTNRCVQAFVKYGQNNTLNIPTLTNTSVSAGWNYIFENAEGHSITTLDLNYKVPIYLLPDIQINNHTIIPEKSALIGTFFVTSPFFGPNDNIDELDLDDFENIDWTHLIKKESFNASVTVNTLRISNINEINIYESGLTGVNHIIISASEEECDDIWENGWSNGAGEIEFDANLSPEEQEARRVERERRQAERAEQERLAAERAEQARLEAERAEQERLAREQQERAEREQREREEREQREREAAERRRREEEERARNLRYKVLGKEVKIIGIRRPFEIIDIPAVIEGKPVTVIGAYAFYDQSSIRHINLPSSIKKIEAGAFMGCSSLDSVTRDYLEKLADNPLIPFPKSARDYYGLNVR